MKQEKSVLIGFLLALLFGPLGLLYSSIVGGLVMIVASIIIAIFTQGYGLILTWIICIVCSIIITTGSESSKGVDIARNNPTNNDTKENLFNQLSQLHDLKEKGVLTEDIYEKERKQILDKIASL